MADNKVIWGHSGTSETLYFHVWDSDGEIWGGAGFAAYSSGSWANYKIDLTEEGASRVHVGTFPAAVAGSYLAIVYQKAGTSAAEGDPLLGSLNVEWDGTDFVTVQAVKTVTDKIDDTLANNGGTFRFTAASLALGPDSSSDATAANQVAIADAITALSIPAASAIATAVGDELIDGDLTIRAALARIASVVAGKVVVTTEEGTLILTCYEDDDTTPLIILTVQTDGSGRTKA